MRRILVFLALVAALTVPVGLAAAGPSDGTLSVKRGRGAMTLKLKGTVIGRVRTGRVQIRDFRPFDPYDPQLTGCRVRHPHVGVYVCKGRSIGFRVDERRYNVGVRGSGISISAAGRGSVVVDGAGDLGVNDGTMSIDDAPYESLPDVATTFFLGTPPPVH